MRMNDQPDELAGEDWLIDLDDIRRLDIERRLQAVASHQRAQMRRAEIFQKKT